MRRQRRPKFTLIKTTCPRCGKPVSSGNRSLFGLDDLKRRLGNVCGDCITPAEREELDAAFRNPTTPPFGGRAA